MAGDLVVAPPSSRLVASGDISHSPPSAAAAAEPSVAATTSKRPLLNPSVHVDLALNIAILQFVDDKGNVTVSIPSEKQLKAYRDHTAPVDHGTKAATPR